MIRIFAYVILGSGALASCGRPPAPSVRFRTPDGFSIVGDLHLPSRDPSRAAPLVLLGHELERDRRAWTPLIPRLLRAGYAVVAVDHRGFGESTREAASPEALSEEARANLGLDLLGAIRAAGATARVDTSRVAVVGAGVSVPGAVQCARENPATRLLVLLPGVLGREGEEFLLGHPEMPLLLVAASGDEQGVFLMRQYAGRFTGPDQVYVEIPAATPGGVAAWRGTDGLAGDTGLPELILWFLESHLSPERGTGR